MPSTVIKSFTYDESVERLRIVFQTGKVYDYLKVPKVIYEEMKAAFSKGIYFNEKVKPYYNCEKISD